MSFQDFDLIEDNRKVRCRTCGKVMDTGIVNISQHWVRCTGKDFHAAIMSHTESGGKLTIGLIEELSEKHLNK